MFAGLRRIMRCLVPHALAVASLAIMLGVCSPANAVARAGQGGLSRSRTIGPRVSATIRLGPRTYLVVPKNTVDQAGRISVVFLPKHAFVVDISVPWRRRVKVVAYARGRRRVELIGGILFAHDASKAIASVAGTVRGHAAISLNPLGNVCVKIGIAVGAAALETGPFDPEIDGAAVADCLLSQSTSYLARSDASQLAADLGHDCLAALAKSTTNDVKAVFFDVPQCNGPTGPTGPSNGTPLYVATLTYPTLSGIPLGPPSATSGPVTTSGPVATSSPKSPPATASLPPGEFEVMNAVGGIYWRSAPDWNTSEASPGNGFYPGTIIRVSCYQAGAADVPGSADDMWEQGTWVSGPGSGSGWINEHFINDGAPINQPSPGVSACPQAPPPPPPPQTWLEQETPNHPVNTFTDYHNASGMGPPIAAGQWVEVSCKVYDPTIASVNPDGYWYRIASSPWNNVYYSPANTFMNGDPYGGPYTHNTDFSVPNC